MIISKFAISHDDISIGEISFIHEKKKKKKKSSSNKLVSSIIIVLNISQEAFERVIWRAEVLNSGLNEMYLMYLHKVCCGVVPTVSI